MFTYIKVRKLPNKCPLCGGRIRLEMRKEAYDTEYEYAICESCGTEAYTGRSMDIGDGFG